MCMSGSKRQKSKVKRKQCKTSGDEEASCGMARRQQMKDSGYIGFYF